MHDYHHDLADSSNQMQHLATTDYNGTQSWHDIRQMGDEDENYPAYVFATILPRRDTDVLVFQASYHKGPLKRNVRLQHAR